MNIKHAQYMLTVMQEGSITAAAKKLYISQPSLSQMIKLWRPISVLPFLTAPRTRSR